MASVLVADDDDVVRRLACRILTSEGYTVLEATSGFEALLICERQPGSIALLMSSVELPDMTGRELSKLSQASQPDMQVLLAAGRRAAVAGTDVVTKPFTAEELLGRVRETLGLPRRLG